MQTIDRYEIVGRVAAGSSALVWKARDPQLGRDVAIKQLDAGNDQLRPQWRTEARILATLEDDHIVAIYDFLEDSSGAYIVEEWIDGASLGALLTTGARLAPEQAIGVLRGALIGLAHAHARGIVHRDISPANILIDRAGVSKLVDFGLAGVVGSMGSTGARAYLSPEALAGQPVTPRSDVYSAAALLAHLLRGSLSIPPDARGIEQPMNHVITTCLAPDPAQRPPTAAELLAWLEQTASQRYGGGWLSQASVGALVSSVGAVPIVAIAGAGAAGATAGVGAVAQGAATGATATATNVAAVTPQAFATPVGSGMQGVGATAPSTSGQLGVGVHSGAGAVGHGIGKSALIKVAVGVAVAAAAVTATAVALSSGGGSGGTAVNGLPAKADIYLAGATKSSTVPDLGSTKPRRITLKSGAKTVSFSSVTGKIGPAGPGATNGPDGGTESFSNTSLTALNGISGVVDSKGTLFVVGVFLGSSKPTQTGQVDLSNANKAVEQRPQLGQLFWIGDGRTASGQRQKIVVPAGAKDLYVGFADGPAFQGVPADYDDNVGTVSLKVDVN